MNDVCGYRCYCMYIPSHEPVCVILRPYLSLRPQMRLDGLREQRVDALGRVTRVYIRNSKQHAERLYLCERRRMGVEIT
jgi:hypothetical protein